MPGGWTWSRGAALDLGVWEVRGGKNCEDVTFKFIVGSGESGQEVRS